MHSAQSEMQPQNSHECKIKLGYRAMPVEKVPLIVCPCVSSHLVSF